MKFMKNNRVTVSGEIIGRFEYSHEVYGEKFYFGQLKVDRLSRNSDYIPFIVSDRVIEVSEEWRGRLVEIQGTLRSYNKHEDNKNSLRLVVFGHAIKQVEDDCNNNLIEIVGHICKPPVYRKTPLGREVADLFVSVSRAYRKRDHIPCIVWGKTAVYSSGLNIGTKVKIKGRIQSREYIKKISEEVTETRVAYEVSASYMQVLEEQE